MLKLLQYCNYIIIVMQIKLMLLLLLLGTFLAISRISSNFFVFRATFCILKKFLQLSSNSDISKRLLVLKLTFLSYFTMSQQTIYEFPVKKGAQSSPLGQIMGSGFQRKFKMVDEEGHSTILLAHYIFLVLIEDKVIQQRWLRRKIAQKCLLLLYNLHILASDQKKVLFLRATFEQLLMVF